MAPKLTNTTLEHWFNQSLGQRYCTQLIGGGDEPEYIPASDGGVHRILYRNDYIASALHELAHWSIASATRGELSDYGYWYEPDGRNKQQQQLFEQVEIKPQAIEWLFAIACGVAFSVSADNLDQSTGPSEAFVANVVAQAKHYCSGNLPPRAYQIIVGLVGQFNVVNVADVLNEHHYSFDKLHGQGCH